MDIKCKKLECVHNKNIACKAKKIKVDSKLKCTTFVKGNIDAVKKDYTKTMFEVAPNFENFRGSKSIDISCDAVCLFNKNGKCRANGITVIDNKSGICATNLKK